MSSDPGYGFPTEGEPYMTRARRRRLSRRRNRLRKPIEILRDSRLARGAGIAGLATVVIGTTTTLATYTDTAILAADVSSGIELAALNSDEGIVALSRQPGTELAHLTTDKLVPGATVEVPVRIGNNSPSSAISPTIRVTAEPTDGTPGELLEHVTTVITQDDGDKRRDITEPHQDPDGDASGHEIRAAPEPLEPRQGAAQQTGETYSGGSDASAVYTILLTLEDAPELREFNAASWDVSISLEGMSQSL